jgi:hypothetical protein
MEQRYLPAVDGRDHSENHHQQPEQVLALSVKYRKSRSLYDRPPSFEIIFDQAGKISPRDACNLIGYFGKRRLGFRFFEHVTEQRARAR